VCFCFGLCVLFVILVHVAELCFSASKKKTKDKSKTSSVDATDAGSVTEGLGKPLQGRPLNEEMIVMEGNSNIPPKSVNAPPADIHISDSSEVKRDDL